MIAQGEGDGCSILAGQRQAGGPSVACGEVADSLDEHLAPAWASVGLLPTLGDRQVMIVQLRTASKDTNHTLSSRLQHEHGLLCLVGTYLIRFLFSLGHWEMFLQVLGLAPKVCGSPILDTWLTSKGRGRGQVVRTWRGCIVCSRWWTTARSAGCQPGPKIWFVWFSL